MVIAKNVIAYVVWLVATVARSRNEKNATYAYRMAPHVCSTVAPTARGGGVGIPGNSLGHGFTSLSTLFSYARRVSAKRRSREPGQNCGWYIMRRSSTIPF